MSIDAIAIVYRIASIYVQGKVQHHSVQSQFVCHSLDELYEVVSCQSMQSQLCIASQVFMFRAIDIFLYNPTPVRPVIRAGFRVGYTMMSATGFSPRFSTDLLFLMHRKKRLQEFDNFF